MTPDPEAAQWKKIDRNSERLDKVNRELGGIQQDLSSMKDWQGNMEQGFARLESKLDQALERQQQRSGAEALGWRIIKTVAAISSALVGFWVWLKSRGG